MNGANVLFLIYILSIARCSFIRRRNTVKTCQYNVDLTRLISYTFKHHVKQVYQQVCKIKIYIKRTVKKCNNICNINDIFPLVILCLKYVFVENNGPLSRIYIVSYSVSLNNLLNPNTNGRGLYHGTTCRSQCCTIAKNDISFLLQNTHNAAFMSKSKTWLTMNQDNVRVERHAYQQTEFMLERG